MSESETKELVFEKDLFGAKIVIKLYDVDEMIASEVLEDVYAEALRLQKIFNFYDKESELSKLNESRSAYVSEELYEVVSRAIELCKHTNGEYDITLGKKFLERKGKQQSDVQSEVKCSYKDVLLNENMITLTHSDIMIDLGSIAKGYIADKIAEFLQSYGVEDGMIDARGDIVFFGTEKEVGVQHPRKDELIHTIRIQNSGVATSGDYKQYIGNYSNSHVLNQKDVISATVIADSLTDADAYATMLMVCNPEIRERLIVEKGFPAMIMDNNLNVKYYNGFEELILPVKGVKLSEN